MMDGTNQRKVPPVVFIGGVVALVVCVVAGVAVFEANSGGASEDAASAAQPAMPVTRVGAFAEPGSVRKQVAQTAQHQDLGLMAMAPMYTPAVAGVELFAPDAEEPTSTVTGFFVGPGRLAVPRSAVAGSVRGEVVLDIGRRFEVQRIVADVPQVDLVLLQVDLPSELARGFQVAVLEPFPEETLLLMGAAAKPGEEDPGHPLSVLEVSRVRVVEQVVRIVMASPLPESSQGSPLLTDTGKLAGYVGLDAQGEQLVYGAERLLRLEPLPGLTLAEWTAGTSVESTRPPPETEDLWAEIRALPRPEGFDAAPMEFRGFDVRPAQIELVEGDLRLDERFTVTGSGTKADPYVLPWALMMSASETFNPARAKEVLPERVTMFDGEWVRFEGSLAIPFAGRFVSEMLLMQHPWDGCCLGVAPTPYDAIEISLAAPIEHRPQFGVVTGKLKVDPFVDRNYLYGMYLMEGAGLTRPAEALEDN